MKIRSIAAALSCAMLMPVLAACGTSDPVESSGTPAAGTSADCSTDVATVTGPVNLTDSFGRSVALDKPAERVAVLEWQQIEDVLTLCTTPVAVADAKGYARWNTAEKLPDGVADVGVRGEPNLDALFATNPDLVIIEAYTPEDPIIKQLAEYDVPVLATKGADAADPIANMLATFNLIAQALGRAELATAVSGEFQASLAEAKQTVADAAVENPNFVFFDGWVQGGNVALRPFGQGSLIGELGEAVGLTNAWTGEVDAAYGLGQTDIEGMGKVGDATFFHSGTVDPDSGDVMAELKKNTIWNSLPAVSQGRAHAFPTGVWTFGGPRSSEQIIDAYVDVLTR